MFEQPNDKPTATPPSAGAAASQPAATGQPAAGATINDESVKAYLAANPGVLGSLTTKLKVNGKDVDVPFSELSGHAQKGLAATQTWEAAAAKEKELERREAELAAKGDPFKTLLDAYGAKNTPPPPASPLQSISDPNDILVNPALAISVMQKQEQELASLRAEMQKLGQTSEARAAEITQKAERGLASYRQYVDLRDQFDAARKADPTFTATVTGMDDNGKPTIDFGDNPYVSAIAVSLKYGTADVPSAILGGKAAAGMSLGQVVAAVRADNAKRVKDAELLEQQRIERERSTAVGGIAAASSPAPFELPADLRPSKDDTPEQRADKVRRLEEIVHKRARDAGVKYDIPQA